MKTQQYTDEQWRKRLKPEVYEALRLGRMEAPGTGALLHNHKDGIYYCAGCGAALFHSRDQVDDGSGYLAFSMPIQDDAVNVEATYSDDGSTVTRLVCTQCGGRVGRLSTLELQSDEDLTKGTVERLYQVSSHAVFFKKALTVRNYPLGALVVLLALVAGAVFAWSWSKDLIATATLEGVRDAIPVWIGDAQYNATFVHLNNIEPLRGSALSENEVLVIILDRTIGVPQVRFANMPIDVVWLDGMFKVITVERGRSPDDTTPFVSPEGAQYLLIAKAGVLGSTAVQPGSEVLITDKTKLLK